MTGLYQQLVAEIWQAIQESRDKDQVIKAKDQEIQTKDQEIKAKDQEIQRLKSAVAVFRIVAPEQYETYMQALS